MKPFLTAAIAMMSCVTMLQAQGTTRLKGITAITVTDPDTSGSGLPEQAGAADWRTIIELELRKAGIVVSPMPDTVRGGEGQIFLDVKSVDARQSGAVVGYALSVRLELWRWARNISPDASLIFTPVWAESDLGVVGKASSSVRSMTREMIERQIRELANAILASR